MARLPSARIAAAILLLGAAASGCVDAPTEHRVRANAYLRGGDANAALKEIDLGLAKKKNDVPLLILRGNALFELERMPEAEDAYNNAVTAGKDLPERSLADAHLGLAMIASRRKDHAAARKYFETLVRINDGKDATSHLNVARVCLEQKDIDCAVTHAETANKLRPNEENVLYTLGTIYLAAGKPGDAELAFQHICEILPGASSCPYGIALVAAKTGDKARAIAKLREAVDRKIPNPRQIANEPGFAPIKNEPEFIDLAAKATAAASK